MYDWLNVYLCMREFPLQIILIKQLDIEEWSTGLQRQQSEIIRFKLVG